jgi:hypothetical protein
MPALNPKVFLSKLKSKIFIDNKIFIDLGNYENTVFLAGTGRSGTTWIQNVINHEANYRIMFEPFHSKKIELLKAWNFRQYLRSNDRNPVFLKPASVILRGQIKDPWIDQLNKKILVNKRLIKDIRTNLILYWIKHNFPQIPIIFLLRHPCAIAASKLKLGWEAHLEEFLSQDELIDDFLSPFTKEIVATKDPFEKLIYSWCVENYVPLKQFRAGDILVIFYEDFYLHPQQNIEAMKSFLHVPFKPNSGSFSEEILNQPSSTSRKDGAIFSKANPINYWRKDINDQQIKRAVEILEMFGLNQIYNDGNLPLLNGEQALQLFSGASTRSSNVICP